MAKRKSKAPREEPGACVKCGAACKWTGDGDRAVCTGDPAKCENAAEARGERRVAKLSGWLESDLASWLRSSLVDVQRETAEMYPDENLERPARYAVVEKLELPGHGDVIVSTHATEQLAAECYKRLTLDAGDTSWHPVAVVDLDTGDEMKTHLVVQLEPVAGTRRRKRLCPANARRAKRVRQALTASGYNDEPSADVADVLVDLRHYSRSAGVSFASALRSSRMHHDAERGAGDDIEQSSRAHDARKRKGAKRLDNTLLGSLLEALDADIYTDAPEMSEAVERVRVLAEKLGGSTDRAQTPRSEDPTS